MQIVNAKKYVLYVGWLALVPLIVSAEPIERRFKSNVKYTNHSMAVIIETSVYDMYQDFLDESPESFTTRINRLSTPEPIMAIIDGLNYLEDSTLPQDATMAKKWGLKNTSSSAWLEWFGNRVKLITGGEPMSDEFWGERFSIDYDYPVKDQRVHKAPRAPMRAIDVPKNTVAQAANYSGVLQDRIQEKGFSFRYRGTHHPEVVSGSNFGIIQILPRFFTSSRNLILEKNSNRYKEVSFQSYVAQNSILMHEARHSDGSDHFQHVTCPKGHPMHEGDKQNRTKRCDRSQNGPYSISAEFSKLYLRACKSDPGANANGVCSEFDINLIEGKILQDYSQVLTADIYPLDGDGNKVVEWIDSTPVTYDGIPKIHIKK
jgi:hypothetical protein